MKYMSTVYPPIAIESGNVHWLPGFVPLSSRGTTLAPPQSHRDLPLFVLSTLHLRERHAPPVPS